MNLQVVRKSGTDMSVFSHCRSFSTVIRKPIIQSPLNLKHIVSVVLLIVNIIIMTNNHIIILRLHSSRLAAGNLPQCSYSHYDH